MESFPQEVPNDSERIDDKEKAEAMAYAGDPYRTAGAIMREGIKDIAQDSILERGLTRAAAEESDRIANIAEDKAGSDFEKNN